MTGKSWHEKAQHFLKKPEIFEPFIHEDDKIIEIGAGYGAITKLISEKNKRSIAYEIDRDFSEELSRIKGIKIVMDDCLKHDWRGHNKIISNIPFQIAEQVMKKAILDGIDEIILLVSEKTRYKLLSDEEFGWMIRRYYDVEVLENIPPEYYEPPPSTETWMVKLTKKNQISDRDKIILDIYLKKGKIGNAIIKALTNQGLTKNEARETINKMNIDKESLEKPSNMATVALLRIIDKELEINYR